MRSPAIPILLTLALAVGGGCGRDEALISMMQVSFVEQFEAACGSDKQCVRDLSTHADACFDPALAKQAIGAKKPDQAQVNSAHIQKFQACIAAKSGVDHWESKDMADFILSQVD